MGKKWFFLGAITFFLWGIINTYFSVVRYGIEQGMYMWFCNLALFAIAYGLWRKDTSWLITWVSFALLTQSFWIIDNLWRIVTKKNLFGMIEFMYQPGYPLDEFLVSHYHYFMIPTMIFALLFLKQNRANSRRLSIICGIFVFGISYLFFPQEQNLNCVRESCFPALENLKGPVYSFIFSLTVMSLGATLAYFIEKVHRKITLTKKQKSAAVYVFLGIILMSITLSIVDVSYKKTLPKFTCLSPFENFKMTISCNYSTEYKDEKMWFVYNVYNKLSKSKICTTKININGNELVMHKDLLIEPHKKYNMVFVLEYPKIDTLAKLSVSC